MRVGILYQIVAAGSVIILVCSGLAFAQKTANNPEGQKTRLEIEKLQSEISALKQKGTELPIWLTTAIGAVGGLIGAVGGIMTTRIGARLSARGAVDQGVHGKRLELYLGLVKATEPMAIFFPEGEALTPYDCGKVGEALRAWYFSVGGLLLSEKARDAYFALARALTRAASADYLNAPSFPTDAEAVSDKSIDAYRTELSDTEPCFRDPDKWVFGRSVDRSASPAQRFKDFVVLQRLSSKLRSELAADLQSRRRPANS